MSKRIFVLDLFRGMIVFVMISFDLPPTTEIYPIVQHAAWEGLTIAEFPFPFFVLVMGMSAAVSYSRKPASFKKIFRRAGLLFLIGLIFNDLPYVFMYMVQENFSAADFYTIGIEHWRIFGILQRFALTYALGMLIVKFVESDKKILGAAFLLLIISSMGFHIYSPDNPFDVNHNISGTIDLIFPGANHILTPTHDPEGLYGTLSATGEMLIGFLSGKILVDNISVSEKFRNLLIFGAVIFLTGYVWSSVDIISKQIWTSPFSLITAGSGIITTAFLLIISDIFPIVQKIFKPIASLGKSPLLYFLGSVCGLIILSGTERWVWLWQVTFYDFISIPFGALLFCLTWATLWTVIATVIDKLGIVIKV